ncbi:tRNA 2-thiouridine synthesizing protein D [Mesocricetibacter intestinalis]|uniref:tRNA 2-thiouridine synthesizing protein D n=1 Tax=Mesocricetibacter intestinalis TaxID=1521930 RepID=A0A4R6VBD8_9PAST|nr:sulfurtransferase complex subunit TusD [Mesocricetibacter intestinalis]TDQ57580.1 tRNA 2-thiouridine synthesizing protein D [Mesocricetibacter intestinalis]
MRYVLAVKQPVYGSQGAYLAYQFASALLRKGHEISQIFFFQNGVSNANAYVYPANDEFNLLAAWQKLQREYHVPLHLCVAASQRRGVVDTSSAADKQHCNLAAGFIIAGLGEFISAVAGADRVITL